MSNLGWFECADVRVVPDIWTPSRIPTALWLDAADVNTVTANAGLISQWNDKSGNGRNATENNNTYKPAYGTLTRLGRNVIDLGSGGKSLSLPTILTAAVDWSFFIACNPASATGTGALAYIIDSQTGRLIFAQRYAASSPYNKLAYYSGGAWRIGAAAEAGPQILEFMFTGTTGYIKRNSVILSTLAHTASAVSRITRLFSQYDVPNSNTLDGSVYEILLIPYIPSEIIQGRITGYLAHKWGLN